MKKQPGVSQAQKSKLAEYEAFLNDRLKVDLTSFETSRAKAEKELQQLQDLENNIKLIQENKLLRLKSQVNLGCDVYCTAEVPDTSRMLLAVGLGFYVECSLQEALAVVTDKKQLVTAKIDECTSRIVGVRTDIQFVQEGIREMMGLGS